MSRTNTAVAAALEHARGRLANMTADERQVLATYLRAAAELGGRTGLSRALARDARELAAELEQESAA